MNEELHEPTPSEGVVRLFPLPNLVLFPHVVQALHIFEPRYRQMMADSLNDDRQFAMALLRPGWEMDYHNRPPIYPTVCLGRIHAEEQLPDGRYNLLLSGVRRAEVLEELSTDRLYRTARVRWLVDMPMVSVNELNIEHRLDHLARIWAEQADATAEIAPLLQGGLSLAVLIDVLAHVLPLPLEQKQALLEEACVESRSQQVLAGLQGLIAQFSPRPSRPFPPHFSDN